jgi:hypothetical protein
VHDQPEPTPEEHERATEHQDDAEEQQGATPADPTLPGDAPPSEPVHES